MKEKKSSKLLRLDKYLADMGIGTRAQIKEMARRKLIQVNGTTVLRTDLKIDPLADTVDVKGHHVEYQQYEYYMMNKPAGVVSATKDRQDQTVMDLIKDKQRKDLFPVGRLDKDTEGLLLITNDGGLAHRLLSPKKHVKKQYYARISGVVQEQDIRIFRNGMDIGDDKPALPAELEILAAGAVSEVLITICEGRFHQVKRMVEAVGKSVVYLKRLKMGILVLDELLNPGEYRKLTAEEIEGLKNTDVRE